MILKIFTVLDIKSKAYIPPFYMPTTEMAVRTFTNMANDVNHQFGLNPEDFILHEIGTFDDATATLIQYDSIQAIGTAIQFIKHEKIEELET